MPPEDAERVRMRKSGMVRAMAANQVVTRTYQAHVDFHRRREQDRPSQPRAIVRGNHTLPHIHRADGSGDIDHNTEPEDGDDSDSLAGR